MIGNYLKSDIVTRYCGKVFVTNKTKKQVKSKKKDIKKKQRYKMIRQIITI